MHQLLWVILSKLQLMFPFLFSKKHTFVYLYRHWVICLIWTLFKFIFLTCNLPRYLWFLDPSSSPMASLLHKIARKFGRSSSGTRGKVGHFQLTTKRSISLLYLYYCLLFVHRFEDAIDAFVQIFDGDNGYWLLAWTLGNMCSIAVFNFAGTFLVIPNF